jgi:UDP-N-acetylglucosamine 1-carboxyvinyltransferase
VGRGTLRRSVTARRGCHARVRQNYRFLRPCVIADGLWTWLHGKIRVSGAKNAALPILCATLLSDGESLLRNVPKLRDIDTTAALLRFLGRDVTVDAPLVHGRAAATCRPEAPYELVKQMRASVLVLGPLLARSRPREGLAARRLPDRRAPGRSAPQGPRGHGRHDPPPRGYVIAEAARLRGAEIVFDLPTVTGTENLMMAAALAKGRTTLVNCAREPEVEELGRVLNKMGARVDGAGTDVIHIEGADELEPFDHAIISDRIEAGTYMVAAAPRAATCCWSTPPRRSRGGGRQAAPGRRRGGAGGDCVRVRRDPDTPLRAVDITTAPHPGFPTDMQAQFMGSCASRRAPVAHHRDHLREPLHARARAAPHGRRHRRRRPHGATCNGKPPLSGRERDGDRSARQRLARHRRPGRRGRDRGAPRLPPRPRLRGTWRTSSQALGADARSHHGRAHERRGAQAAHDRRAERPDLEGPRATLARAGVDTEPLARRRPAPGAAQRTTSAPAFIFLKPDDVPTYVEYGAADIGVSGATRCSSALRSLHAGRSRHRQVPPGGRRARGAVAARRAADRHEIPAHRRRPTSPSAESRRR